MLLLSIENIARSFGEKILFTGLKFGIEKGEKVALVAPNGTGKSCLLRILAGTDIPDEGTVIRRNDLRLAFLDQDPFFPEERSIAEYINSVNTGILALLREYESLTNSVHLHQEKATHDRLIQLTTQMDERHAWDYERRLIELLSVFRIPDGNKKISTLSGGQRKRLALALALSSTPEFLLLDEPTNHLDIAMTEWLEDYLSGTEITLLMVTHDRYFLDRVCSRILELNQRKLYEWNGNYSYYLEKRALLDEVMEAETEKARNLLRKELDWMRRMPKARTTKSKSRIDAFYELQEKAGYRKPIRELKLEVSMARMGGQILELKAVSKSFENTVILDNLNYIFSKGERLGLIGENGVGKTTFLNLITGREKLDSGQIETGETIRFGYYTQEGIRLTEDKRVIEVLKDVAEFIEVANGKTLSASQFLQHFMFTPEQQYTQVSKLSGGERRRLHLLMVLMKNPNFLVLDEPTNDLDLFTMNRLEEFLLGFKGCLILVSHDRYFLDKLVDHLFIMEGEGKILDYTGTYSEYKEERELELLEKAREEKIRKEQTAEKYKTSAGQPSGKRKLTYKEKLEYESLDKEIPALELHIQELEANLQSVAEDYEAYNRLSAQLMERKKDLDQKSHRWLELAELL